MVTSFEHIIPWWSNLEDQWKQAYNEAILGHGPITDMPSETELESIWTAPALRFMGPKGYYPNMTFELTNMSGIEGLSALKILVIAFHQVISAEEVQHLTGLESLFIFNNNIDNLDPVKGLTNLRELYFQGNRVRDLKALKKLTNLHKIYAIQNRLSSLKGLTKKHAKTLKEFYCLPNDDLPDSEVLRIEQELRIRCLKA